MEIVQLNNPSSNQHLLDIKENTPRGEIHAIAVCESCVMRRDINKEPFVRYILRDIYGRRVVGRQFDLKEVSDLTSLMVKLQNNIVLVHGQFGYFKQKYLQITSCEACSREVSKTVKDKFFTTNVPNYEAELTMFREFITVIASKEVKSLMSVLDVENYLILSYNVGICDGLRGSSIMLINTFNNSLAQITGRQGSSLMLANMLIEYLMSKGEQDPARVLEEISSLHNIISQSVTVELSKLFDIIKGSIYLHYDFQLNMFNSDAFIINTVRKFCYDVTIQKELFSNSDGVFIYEGYTVSKGDVG